MKKLSFISIILFVFLSACIKDPVRYYIDVYINNQSSKPIWLNRFGKKNDEYTKDNVEIKAGENKKVFFISGTGNVNKNIHAFWGNEFTDSVVITYQGDVNATHLNKQHRVTPRTNLIPFDDARNILNPKNYVIATKGRNYEIVYTFTEQDYLNAK